jgi:hypothetical protein
MLGLSSLVTQAASASGRTSARHLAETLKPLLVTPRSSERRC